MNSEDFDFSVKGKGHQVKGKSPTKKTEAEHVREHQQTSKKATPAPVTPVSTTVTKKRSSQTPVTTKASPAPVATSSERPKRELRKRTKSEPEGKLKEPEPEEAVIEELDDEMNDDLDDDLDDKHQVSNVKL